MYTKHIVITLIAFMGLLLSESTAQVTGRGNFIIGGTLGFSSSSSTVDISGEDTNVQNEDTKATQFNIAPSLGYFFAENLALGVGFDYTLNKIEEPINFEGEEQRTQTEFDSDLLFGPFARYYLPVGLDKAFFIEATFGFGSSVDEVELQSGDQNTSTTVFAMGVGPGFTIFSRDAIGIEALVKYNWANSNTDISFQGIETEAETITNQIDFSVGLQFYFTRLKPATTEERIPEDGDPDFFQRP